MDVCDQWKKDRSINPRTNRKIKPTGKVYKALEVECASTKSSRSPKGSPKRPGRGQDPYSPKCLKWHSNPGINPITDRKIKIGGPTYQRLEEECGSPAAGIKAAGIKAAGIKAAPPAAAPPAPDECDEWRANPGKNPRTGRAISLRGKVYQWYKRECANSAPIYLTWFKERLDKGLRINNRLRAINADQWDMCMTGISAPAFRKKNFSNVVEIGRGSFGQIYRATLKGNDDQLVIKEAYLRPNEKRVLKEATDKNQKWEDVKKNSYPHENRILDLVNQLLLSRRCPNFVYIYNMAMCDGCRVHRLFDKGGSDSGSCYVTFMESADTDLARLGLLGPQRPHSRKQTRYRPWQTAAQRSLVF